MANRIVLPEAEERGPEEERSELRKAAEGAVAKVPQHRQQCASSQITAQDFPSRDVRSVHNGKFGRRHLELFSPSVVYVIRQFHQESIV